MMRISRATQHSFDAETCQALNAWYDSALGMHLLDRERALINKALSRRFGYRLLQLGCSDHLLYEQSPIGHRFSFSPFGNLQSPHSAIAQGEAIPLAAESIDLVLLHHALDFSNHQHQLLREASRVLIAGGHIVIVGFNPISTWGLRNSCQWRQRSRAPWQASLLSSLRLSDWLALLDFQIDSIQYAGYTMPVNSEAVIRWTGKLEPLAQRLNWPTGAIYMITARKQVMPLTPVQLKWRKMPAIGLGGQEPVSNLSQPLNHDSGHH